jgi:hypothetical protein
VSHDVIGQDNNRPHSTYYIVVHFWATSQKRTDILLLSFIFPTRYIGSKFNFILTFNIIASNSKTRQNLNGREITYCDRSNIAAGKNSCLVQYLWDSTAWMLIVHLFIEWYQCAFVFRVLVHSQLPWLFQPVNTPQMHNTTMKKNNIFWSSIWGPAAL